MKKLVVFRIGIFCIVLILLLGITADAIHESAPVNIVSSLWSVKSIDTMKYSRDLAQQKLKDESFNAVIDKQMADIAATGANYVAVDTPYDEEFYPMLARWVASARQHNLHVWFRGNFSGWEGWFNYPKIDRQQHLQMTEMFISAHPDLFSDGDIFTACPECENGGPGDPRQTGDVAGFRQFMIDEYHVTSSAFAAINKNVITNYDSLNYDVALKVMDKPTAQALGGVVVVDHYIADPQEYTTDINTLAAQSGAHIVLGEFGAPIPDIHGQMSEADQSAWINSTLQNLAYLPEVTGLNYWADTGSSTALWNADGTARQAVDVVKNFYQYHPISGIVKNDAGETLSGVTIATTDKTMSLRSGENGLFVFPYLPSKTPFTFSLSGYTSKTVVLENQNSPYSIVLKKQRPSWLYTLKRIFY